MNIFLIVVGLILLFCLCVFGFLLFFYRDPNRVSPNSENAILAPTDGRIGYIKKIKSGEINFSEKKGKKINLTDILQNKAFDKTQDYYLIGILMSFFNVHFQRAPIAGTVYDQKYIEGKFLDIRFSKKILEFEGERNVTYIKAANGNFFAVVMQIASNSVRRIVSYVKPNDNITRGQKIGLIRFGSQVDLIIPAKNVKLLVREKSSVKARLTIIGELQNE